MVALLPLLLIIVTLRRAVCEEPQCSRFHYESQMLDKMIRMEVKVEAMEKEILKTNQLVQEALHKLENKQHELTEFETKIAAEVDNMRETLLIPTIAFKARGPADLSLETGQTVIYNTIMLNEGGAYNNVTGIFTVPVAGTYLFTIHFCILNKNSYYYGIVADDVVYTSGRVYDEQAYVCYAADALLVLQTGQKVWSKCLSGSTNNVLYEYSSTTYNYWNTFSGILIHK